MSTKPLNPKIHGTTTVNSKGQIVIPSEVRHALGINSGDQMIVISKGSYGIGLIKADTLHEFLAAVRKQHPEAFEGLDDMN